MGSERASASVFISATSGDLATVREIVKQGLLTMHCLPVEQGHFAPDHRTVASMLEERIAGCDAMVHLVGLRYGAEADPATLPAGTARRSYTQMEAEIARRLGKKLYVFVCPEDFGYDACEPEPEEKVALQRAYREKILRGETLYTPVPTRDEVALRVRELQLDLERMRAQLRAQSRRGVLVAYGSFVLLAGLGGAVWWNSQRTPAVIQAMVHQEVQASQNLPQIKTNLENQIAARAAEEIRKLDRVNDWRKVAEIEVTRDQQLRDVDRMLEQMARAFATKEASADYALASEILAKKGVAEALAFLESKSGKREMEIASLKEGVSAEKNKLREKLREKLLAASLLEKSLQFDEAETQYRAVIADDPTWAEPRNALAWLLTQRGDVVDPVRGNAMLREAASLCRENLSPDPPATSPDDWASLQINLGNALQRQGTRAEGAESRRLLSEAVAAYRKVLQVYTPEQQPETWAQTQGNLAVALTEQGERVEGAESRRVLDEAAAACRDAMKVRTREQWPEGWVTTQSNLANALLRRGERADGAESQRLLAEAAAIYRDVSKVYAQEKRAEDWAKMQVNLALALVDQGEHAEVAEARRLFREAAVTDREALKVFTHEQWPQYWAKTQNNLGAVLIHQGERVEGEEAQRSFEGAAAAFREILKFSTREQLPQDWAEAQTNLANVLLRQAEQASGAEAPRLLQEAVAAYREAQKVLTREQLPQAWALAQNNLALALVYQSERADSAEARRLLGEAVTAFMAALKVRTRVQFPQDWALTQNDLGNALLRKGERAEGAEAQRLLSEAVTAYREAIKVQTRDDFPQQWAMAQCNMGTAFVDQGMRAKGAEGLRLFGEALAAYRAALRVQTREQLPQDWARTQNGLGNVFLNQAVRVAKVAEAKRLLDEAVAAYREALKVYTREESPAGWAMAQRNTSIVLKLLARVTSGEESRKFLDEAGEIERQLKVADSAGSAR